MSHPNLSHRRTHNLLLISKLLNQRDHVSSPFTLVLDTLEQTAAPLVKEYIRRANHFTTHVIFLAFETITKPHGVDTFIPCHNKTPVQISQAISSAITKSTTTTTATIKRTLVVIDSLTSLSTISLDTRSNLNLTAYLSMLIAPPRNSASDLSLSPISTFQTSMVAVYHLDVPLTSPPGQSHSYQPEPLSLLSYLATTILKVHSLSTQLSSRLAAERSQIAPQYGLEEEKEGIIVGLKPTKFPGGAILKSADTGVILELEHRRKSGRGVREWYFLPRTTSSNISARRKQQHNAAQQSSTQAQAQAQPFRETVILLDDHPRFRKAKTDEDSTTISKQELAGMTFEIGLTDRQRLEREGVVLPYFDAQKEGGIVGPGEGGRILYDMGEEDDFDEEEDEI